MGGGSVPPLTGGTMSCKSRRSAVPLPFGLFAILCVSATISARPIFFLPVGGRREGGELLPSLVNSREEGGRWWGRGESLGSVKVALASTVAC